MSIQEEIYSHLIRVWFHGYTCQYAYTPKEARNELLRRLPSKTTLLMQAKARYSRLQRHKADLLARLESDYASVYPELQRVKSEMLAIRDEACYRYGLPSEVVQKRMF